MIQVQSHPPEAGLDTLIEPEQWRLVHHLFTLEKMQWNHNISLCWHDGKSLLRPLMSPLMLFAKEHFSFISQNLNTAASVPNLNYLNMSIPVI